MDGVKLTWIEEHKRIWRVTILVLLLVAIMGPWVFDVINVPSKYPCSAPNIRLYNDFCGVPLSGIMILSSMADWFINTSAMLVTGQMVFSEWAREFLFSLFLFLLVLPFFNTLLLILRGDHKRWKRFNTAAWGLGVSEYLLLGIPSLFRFPNHFWALWGIWLFIGLAASALTLEVLVLVAGRSLSQG